MSEDVQFWLVTAVISVFVILYVGGMVQEVFAPLPPKELRKRPEETAPK